MNRVIWLFTAHHLELGSLWPDFIKQNEAPSALRKMKIESHEIIVKITGVGSNKAKHGFDYLWANLSKPDFVLNIGTAGCLKSCSAVGEWFLPSMVRKIKNDGTLTSIIVLNPVYTELISKTLEEINIKINSGNLLSSEKPVNSTKLKKELLKRSDFQLVDMESYDLAYLSNQHCLPFVALKIITDHADDDAVKDYQSYLKNNYEINGERIRKIISSIKI